MQVPITRSVVLLATLSLLLPQGSATRLVAENRNVRSEGILERQATPKGISQSTAPTGASGDFAGLIDIGGGRKNVSRVPWLRQSDGNSRVRLQK